MPYAHRAVHTTRADNWQNVHLKKMGELLTLCIVSKAVWPAQNE